MKPTTTNSKLAGKNFNRRNWLKLCSLTGTSALLSPSLQANPPLTLSITNPIRLSSNENPYGPSPKVREAMSNAYDIVCRYPGSCYKELVGMLAKKYKVSSDNIMLTAGSTVVEL